MPPLSQTECESCSRLSQKISELEGRISVLYQIKDDEVLLDSMLTSTQAITTGLESSVIKAAAATDHDEDPWPLLGAKPKGREVSCSTPRLAEPWSATLSFCSEIHYWRPVQYTPLQTI